MQSIDVIDDESAPRPLSQRRLALKLAGLSLLQPLAACGKGGIPMKKEIEITVVLYSFLDRSLFNIILNGSDIGVTSAYGTTSMVTGVIVPMGEQSLKWTLDGPKGKARNGEVVSLKNKVVIKPSDIPAKADYMGVYLYPDDTAEFTFTEYIPRREATARAEKLTKEQGK